MNDMYSTLDNLFESGASTFTILKYYAFLSPTLIPVFLPISLLLSFIFILGSLHRNNEITAMRAAGMSDLRITRALWIASVVASGFFFWLNASAIPQCKEASRKIYDNAILESKISEGYKGAGVIVSLCFNNRRDKRLWFLNSFSRVTNKGRGVRVSVLDDQAREIYRVMAREGVYDDVDKCWFFVDGQEMEFDAKNNRPIRAVGFDKRYFRNFKERPEIMILSMEKVHDLSLNENKILLDAFGADGEYAAALPYLVRQYSLWLSPLVCVVVLAIAIPFSMTGVRTNPMVGVSKTIGMFFAYFVLESLMNGLGGKGIIPPLVAALIPPCIILVWTAFLYRKVF